MSDQTSPLAEAEQRIADLTAKRFGRDEILLDEFRGMTDEQITALHGIGPHTCRLIRGYLAELDSLLAATAPGGPTPTAPAAPAAELAEEVRARESLSVGLLLTVVAVLLVVVLVIVFAATRGDGSSARSAEGQVGLMRGALTDIERDATAAATVQADRVYEAARVLQLGEAQARLDDLERSLQTVELALRGGARRTGAPTSADDPRLTNARAALAEARAVLALERPAGRLEIESACAKLQETVGLLSPRDEGRHGQE